LVGSEIGRATSEGLDLAHNILSNKLATGSVTGLQGKQEHRMISKVRSVVSVCSSKKGKKTKDSKYLMAAGNKLGKEKSSLGSPLSPVSGFLWKYLR